MSALAKLKSLAERSLEPYMNRVVQGNCLEVMRGFPSESVDMVMFSPAYWGLRDYGEVAETVWGGSDCEHEWIEERMTLVHENRNFSKGTQEEVHGEKPTTYIKKYDDKTAGFCVKCGAWKGQLGLEPTWQMYVEHMVLICREVKRVLKRTGSMYLVLGDTYAGSHCGKGDKTLFQNYRRLKVAGNLYSKPSPQAKTQDYKPKCLMGVPWRVAFALIDDGWILRNEIIWRKPNAMPSSVKDRLTVTHEKIFHFTKIRRYYYDLDAIRIPWTDERKSDIQRALNKHPGYKGKYGKGYNYGFRKFLPGQGIKGQPVGDPRKGKNPGDVFQTQKKPYVGNNPHRMRLNRQKFLALDPARPMDLSHPKGKNPGDIIKVKRGKYKEAGIHSPGERDWYWSEQRPNLPKPRELIVYLQKWKGSLTYKEIDKALGYNGDCSSHWFTEPDSKHGFAYPSKEDWLKLKELLGFDNRFDKQMTETVLVPVTDLGHPKGRNPGDFWSITTKPFKGAHFAVYPEAICVRPIKSSCPPGGVVLDPMCGSGTTLVVARKLGRRYIGIDINPAYVEIAEKRLGFKA